MGLHDPTPAPVDNIQLSTHFSFYELTATTNEALLGENRVQGLSFVPTLRALARLLETVRNGKALVVNSAFRSAVLNGATAGSSPTSQHPLGQAADIHRPGQEVPAFFAETLELLRNERIPFGQLIDEEAVRPYGGVTRWVHISLGSNFWKPERCGEVLRKRDVDGKPKYELLEKIPQEV